MISYLIATSIIILHACVLTHAVHSEPQICDASSADNKCLPSVAIIGAGRMGVHLAATWADAGVSVTLCSRNPDKAEKIVASLLARKGWEERGIQLPPASIPDTSDWNLQSGGISAAVHADVIILAMLPDPTPAFLKTTLKPLIHGQGKYIVDINNPWIMGSGLPSDGPKSSVEVNQLALDDATTFWCAGYKTIYWHELIPGRKKNYVAKRKPVEIAGDNGCKEKLKLLIESHGFTAQDKGGFEHALQLEWMFNRRTRRPVRVHSRDRMKMDGF